jgi:hypothetical protein
MQFFAFRSCVAWNLLELLVLKGMLQFFAFRSRVAWNGLKLLVQTGMQFFAFRSCVAWNLLELLVLTGMLQFFAFRSCVAWNRLELLVLTGMLQFFAFRRSALCVADGEAKSTWQRGSSTNTKLKEKNMPCTAIPDTDSLTVLLASCPPFLH